MQTSNTEIHRLQTLIRDKMHHDYVERYVQTPYPDDDKLYILSSILNHTTLPQQQKTHYIITVMLIQMALDIHDQVLETEDSVLCENEKKTKQLSVLAGDYYSGLYYHILSEIEDVRVTQVLASAITEINDLKMQLFYQMFNSLRSFIDIIKALESRLIIRLAHAFDEKIVSNLTAEWLIVRKLMKIKKDISHVGLNDAFSPWSIQNITQDHKSVMSTIDSVIYEETLVINKELTQFPSCLSSIETYIRDSLYSVSNSQVQ